MATFDGVDDGTVGSGSDLGGAFRSIGGFFNDVTGQTLAQANSARQAALNRDFQDAQAQKQMTFQNQQAQNQMGFQERMSSTAYQRSVSDMRAAGLNPILSASHGGSSSPAGASGSGASGSGSAGGAASGSGIDVLNSAMAAKRLGAELDNMRTMTRNIDADTDKKNSERALNSVTYNRVVHEVDRERALKHIAEEQAKGAKVEGEIDSGRYGAALRYLDRLRGTASTARQFMDAASRTAR